MEELTKRQIRFIIQSDERVLESQEAQDIAAILSAMENPKSLSAMTKARVTPIFWPLYKNLLKKMSKQVCLHVKESKKPMREQKIRCTRCFYRTF